MTKLKALSVLQARSYTLQKYGPEVAERVKAALTEAQRATLYSDQLLPVDWISVDDALAHLTAFDRVMGSGDGETAKTLIREVAASHVKGLYKVLFMLASPNSVLEKSARLWSRAKLPTATHTRCVAKGAEHCETEIRWK
jgi:hypothetical protein